MQNTYTIFTLYIHADFMHLERCWTLFLIFFRGQSLKFPVKIPGQSLDKLERCCMNFGKLNLVKWIYGYMYSTVLYIYWYDEKLTITATYTWIHTQPFSYIDFSRINCVRFQIVSQNKAKNRNCLENWYDKSFLFLFENQWLL